MLQAIVHDVKNKLAELAMVLANAHPQAAAVALDCADKLTQVLLMEPEGSFMARVDAACPADLIEDVVAEYGALFPGKTIVQVLDQAPPVWYYDARLVRLSLSNALHNALRHCHSEVRLCVFERDGELIFEVRDDGSGFTQAMLSDAGQRPAAGDEASRASRSTGLGLLVSRRIAEAHALRKAEVTRRGWIALCNEDGAVVRLGLP